MVSYTASITQVLAKHYRSLLEMPEGQRNAPPHFLVLPQTETLLDSSQKFTEHKIPDDPAFFLPYVSPRKTIPKINCATLIECCKVLHFSALEETNTIDICELDKQSKGHKQNGRLTAQNKHEKYSKTWRLWNLFILSHEGLTFLRS